MSFIVAVLFAVIFLSDWPLESESVPRRLYQIALALGVVAFSISIGAVVFPLGSYEVSIQAAMARGGDGPNTAEVLSDRRILTAALGFSLTIGALSVLAPFRTTCVSLLLAGVVLLLTASVTDQTSLLSSLYDWSAGAGSERNALLMVVLGAGSLALFAFGYNHWDKDDSEEDSLLDPEDAGPAPPSNRPV